MNNPPVVNRITGPSAALSTSNVSSVFGRRSESRQRALAAEIPGFAGFGLDKQGNIVVQVIDTSSRGVASAITARRLAEGKLGDIRLMGGAIKVNVAEFTFAQLSAWRDSATLYLGIQKQLDDQLIGVDLNEMENHILLRISKDAPNDAEGRATRYLVGVGASPRALRFERGERARVTRGRPLPSVKGMFRTFGSPTSLISFAPDTVAAGIAIIPHTGAGGCTLGAAGSFGGNARFMTASHCTTYEFGVTTDTMKAYDDYTPGLRMGVEAEDPSSLGNHGCPFQCHASRNSDAATFTRNLDSISYRTGVIYKTAAIGLTAPATLSIASDKWLHIVGIESEPSMNQGVNHIGIATGWQYGTISETCGDELQSSNNWILCSMKADMGGGDGDSGGPIFYETGFNGVLWGGIQWGVQDIVSTNGDTVLYANSSWFSAPDEIYGDFGTISVANTTTIGSFGTISGSVSSSVPTLSWSALSTSNTNEATTYIITRRVWDAMDQAWLGTASTVYTGTTASFTDSSTPMYSIAYTNTTRPCANEYSYAEYGIMAVNQGRVSYGPTVFVRGGHDGPINPC